MKKILVLTGGGMFGWGQASILSQNMTVFDAYGGTSIGAFNAIMAAKNRAHDAPSFFEIDAAEVFAGRCWRRFMPWCPRYPDTALNDALQAALHGRFGDLKYPTIICADAVDQERPKVFMSTDFDDADWPAWEVARASMAAQTYFEPWKGLADGGLYLNDPVMATATALHQRLAWAYEDMDIFSIGTGVDSGNITEPNIHNPFSWLAHILDAMLRGGSVWTQRHFAKAMPFNRYVHVDFQRPDGMAFDDPSILPMLKREWSLDIQVAIQAINQF